MKFENQKLRSVAIIQTCEQSKEQTNGCGMQNTKEAEKR
jgi:hypothetical protein